MKVEIVDQRKPEMKAGQVWQGQSTKTAFLLVSPFYGGQLHWVALDDFRDVGKAIDTHMMDFVGELKVTP